MSDVIFEARNLTKKYKNQFALDDVSITLKNNRIYGFHDALYFRAEVCVSRCVNDIDLVVLVHDGAVFGVDRDSALSFDRV